MNQDNHVPNIINHIVLVLDESSSMTPKKDEAVKVADAQVEYLAQRSQELDQETRMTVYTFNAGKPPQCVFYDKDVLRLPSLKGFYHPRGSTALIDATLTAINDLEKTAQLYGDHAFLIYVVTDGEENSSMNLPHVLRQKIQYLPENWTLAVLVPDQTGVYEAKRFGFAPQNIAVWNASTTGGVAEVGEIIRKTTDNFMQARKHGLRGSKNIFQLDISKLTESSVERLNHLNPTDYSFLHVYPSDNLNISSFIRSRGRSYQKGMVYYPLLKSETIQSYKQICVVDKNEGDVYTGPEARKLLGLPNQEVRVRKADHPNYAIYIQSTSVNRKLTPESDVLLLNK